MAQIMGDFPIGGEGAAAIVGNLGHECAGFTVLQEIKPTVPGSRGGYGWPQWTGVRRRAYEAYCKRTGKDPASDEANYAYLWIELKGIEGSEGKAIERTKAAKGLDAKVEAFELAFLRAGVKHYPKMSMTPSRRTVAAMTLGGMALDGRSLEVRCYRCRRTRKFLASDLAEVYGTEQIPHTLFGMLKMWDAG